MSADDKLADGKFRCRQNVILELGYFFAKLGRSKLFTLYDTSTQGKKIDIPSDIFGLVYVEYDKEDGGWRNKFIKELQVAGFAVDANKII
jgi:predicted nucleotide-binding protein